MQLSLQAVTPSLQDKRDDFDLRPFKIRRTYKINTECRQYLHAVCFLPERLLATPKPVTAADEVSHSPVVVLGI